MRYFVSLALLALFVSCSNSFINHELKAERIGECTMEKQPVNMNSNINGERYEFDYCLGEGFSDKDYKVERTGDTLFVRFPIPVGKTAMYKLTLDIDAKPAYHLILLGDQIVQVVAAEK